MKTIYKVLISFSIGICLIFVGISMGGLDDIYHVSWLRNIHWHPRLINDIDFQCDRTVRDLELDVHYADVKFYTRDDLDSIQVNVKNVYNGFEIYQDGDELVINQPYYWWFSDYEITQIDIYVPEHSMFEKTDIVMSLGRVAIQNLCTVDLDIESSTGQLECHDFECQNINLDAGLGQTLFYNLTAHKSVDIDLGMGDVYMLLNGYEKEYNYTVDVGMGQVRIGEQKFSGIIDSSSHKKRGYREIDIDCGFGNVEIEMEEN